MASRGVGVAPETVAGAGRDWVAMTDLLNPLTRRLAAARTAAPQDGRRPLSVSAALAGLAAPGSLLLVCWAVALVGWFAADGGSHGTTRSALRVGADAWLLAHGVHLEVGRVLVTASPLGLTAVAAYVTFRFGRWAGRPALGPDGRPPQPEDLRTVGLATVVLSGVYGVVAMVTAVLASVPGVQPDLTLAFVGGAAVGAVAGGLGLLAGTGQLAPAWSRLPLHLRSSAYGAAVVVLLLVVASAALVGVALAVHGSAAANVLAQLHPDTTGGVLSLLLLVMILPNVLLMGAAYLLGPGFAVGVGTVVSPSQVLLGPVPAVPVLAALPATGPGPAWGAALVALPFVLGLAAALLAARRYPTRSWVVAAGRGLGGGALAALVVTVLLALAGGSIGPGRMSELGAPVLETFGVALAGLGAGGALGGLAATWWRRRRVPAEEDPLLDEPTEAVDLAGEETVRLPFPRR